MRHNLSFIYLLSIYLLFITKKTSKNFSHKEKYWGRYQGQTRAFKIDICRGKLSKKHTGVEMTVCPLPTPELHVHV